MNNKRILEHLQGHLMSLYGVKFGENRPNGESVFYRPFFWSLIVKNGQIYDFESVNGSTIVIDTTRPSIVARLETRLGDYERGGGVHSIAFRLPYDLDQRVTALSIRNVANPNCWSCTMDYEKRFNSALGRSEENRRRRYVYFSKEEPVQYIEEEKDFSIDVEELEGRLNHVTRVLSEDPNIISSEIDFRGYKEDRWLVNTEGSCVFTSSFRYRLQLSLNTLDPDNLVLPHAEVFYGSDVSKIPSLEQLLEKGEKIKAELLEIVKVPIQFDGSYPAILGPKNAVVLIHEAVGHPAEAHRMQGGREDSLFGGSSTLFDGRNGELVAPEFLTIYDDPTIKDIVGHYLYDEEGVKAQRTKIIDKGRLTDLLHSRQSAGFFKTKSNGHARAELVGVPVPRMANLIIESSKCVIYTKLVEALIEEVKRQNKEYGLIFEGRIMGEVSPEDSFFETVPSNIFRLYKDGKRERVRRAYIVGTPSEAISNIILTGNQYSVDDGRCGAESGYIPFSGKAPHILLRSLDVNRIREDEYSEFGRVIFPKP